MQKSMEEMAELQAKDVELLKQQCALIRERGGFDSIRIFVTRHENDSTGTTAASWGSGNYYASFGQVSRWVKENEADFPAAPPEG